MLKCGVDRAKDFADLFVGRVALVTSPTGRNAMDESTASVLKRLCDLRLLLAPEHGLSGNRAAGESFGTENDPETGLEVLSLYNGPAKRLPGTVFPQIDTVVYDIQDVGCRYYTFLSTLKMLVEDCSANGKRLIVLDRPNPLGNRVEGPVLQPETASFVGCYEIPVCYGLTCGEFARMVNAELHLYCDLHIIPCEGWKRTQAFPDWGKSWVRPSPNLPDYEAALFYPGTCLIEGTNLSEGRGTDAPFRILGAPFVDGEAFFQWFSELSLPGISAEPVKFTPSASKYNGIPCEGIRLHVTDEVTIHPVELGIRLIRLLQERYPNNLQYIQAEWPLPFLSHLAGHRHFEHPGWDTDALIRKAEQDCEVFRKRKRAFEIYE